MSFYELFDYFWDQGVGNYLDKSGNPKSWNSETLSLEFGEHNIDVNARTIDNWKSHKALPKQKYIRGLALIASPRDDYLFNKWNDAFWKTHRNEKLKRKAWSEKTTENDLIESDIEPHNKKLSFQKAWIFIAGLFGTIGIISAIIVFFSGESEPASFVKKFHICDKYYFDKETKKCKQHVSVFVHGIDEVFLSFDFVNVPKGAAFERWWIRDGERIAGRTSFNDDAWPGYTYWRPKGGLDVGTYVVRLVVDGKVETQTFYVQQDGFIKK